MVWGQGEGTQSGLCVIAGRPLVSTSAPVVPLKFSVPHAVVCFGARGQLVLVCPHHPAKGQLALVELHSLEVCHSLPPQTVLCPLAGVTPFTLRGANTVLTQTASIATFSSPAVIFSPAHMKALHCVSLCLSIAFSLWVLHPALSVL